VRAAPPTMQIGATIFNFVRVDMAMNEALRDGGVA